ncbi:unnamed protein product [Merluccius merluccius]
MPLFKACLLSLHLLTGPGLTGASVFASFRDCSHVFHMHTPPVGIRGKNLKSICQRYRDKARYATLYDGGRRLALYSAYVFKKSDGRGRVDTPWMYEPQLSLLSDTGEMQPFPRGYSPMNFEDAQAVLEDYTNAIMYERGALNPSVHQAQPDDKAATYTLTNVVPQTWEFSAEAWRPQEQVIRKRLNNYCQGTAYVVTGVITSGTMIRRQNIARVAVPAYIWSAYCCVNYDRNAPYNERYKFPAYGHYGLNDKEGGEVVELSVPKLEDFIKKTTFVEKHFQIFSDGCIAPALKLAKK